MVDVLVKLLPAKWRDVEFPTTRFRLSLAHDLVEHKYWGRDGARVEATGLAPLRFSFSAPLTNGIVPGKGERWSVLYPNQFRTLLAAFQLKETGALQHPEFGIVNCKAERMEVDWDATKRGGVDAELTFVQTMPDVGEDFFEDSPVQEVELAALDLDSEQTNKDLDKLLAAKGIVRPKFEKDFTDFARSIQAVGDTVTVLSSRAAGQIDAVVYRANNIIDSCERAKSALTWPAVKQAERIKSAAHDLRQNLLALNGRSIARYRVPADTTIAGVARQIPNAKVGDIIRLNPGLMGSPVVPENTLVRYYREVA